MADLDLVRVVANVPRDLHRSIKRISKKMQMPIQAITLAGLHLYVEQFDLKEQERALKKDEPENTRAPRLGANRVEFDNTPAVDRLAPVFEMHAMRIVAAVDNPAELALRRDQAFAEIKRLAPITYGDHAKIVARLEATIAARSQIEAAREPEEEPRFSLLPPKPAPKPFDPDQFTRMLGQLAIIARGAAPEVVDDDPLVGKSINKGRARDRVVVEDDEESQDE